MSTYRIPFSRIRTTSIRRTIMILAFLPMVACNWLFIALYAAQVLLKLPLIVLVKAVAVPFQLTDKSFTEAWHGRRYVAAPKLGEQEGAKNG